MFKEIGGLFFLINQVKEYSSEIMRKSEKIYILSERK